MDPRVKPEDDAVKGVACTARVLLARRGVLHARCGVLPELGGVLPEGRGEGVTLRSALGSPVSPESVILGLDPRTHATGKDI